MAHSASSDPLVSGGQAPGPITQGTRKQLFPAPVAYPWPSWEQSRCLDLIRNENNRVSALVELHLWPNPKNCLESRHVDSRHIVKSYLFYFLLTSLNLDTGKREHWALATPLNS